MPLAIDLFCGLGGWTEGLLAEGYHVIGFDIEQHQYGDERYPAQLVIQDVLTLHGSQFRDADLIVASPPCQFFSYTAMPWSKARALAAEVRADPVRLEKELALFNACFRIQREASAAAGRHVPMVVENVHGAQPWVGRARWRFGSYLLWGDVPALMPQPVNAKKVPGFRFDGGGGSFQTAAVNEGVKVGGLDWNKRGGGQAFNTITATRSRRSALGNGVRFTSQDCGIEKPVMPISRKAASARIAKIPLTLSRWIASQCKPASLAA